MPLGSRSRSRTKCPLYPLLSCQSSSVAPQMPHEFGYWFSVRSPVNASQRHFPLAPGCLPGLRGGLDGGVHGLAAAERLTSSFLPPSPLDGSAPKGLSGCRRFEEIRRVFTKPPCKFDPNPTQPPEKFETRPRIEPLEKGPVH